MKFTEEIEALKSSKALINLYTANTTLTNIVMQSDKHHISKVKMKKHAKCANQKIKLINIITTIIATKNKHPKLSK